METILNQQGIQYYQAGDYLLPNITVGEKKSITSAHGDTLRPVIV